jgi:hypothetical protein
LIPGEAALLAYGGAFAIECVFLIGALLLFGRLRIGAARVVQEA